MSSSISTLGQQIGLITRMKSIQSQMSEYQQQVTTGVKYQTFAGYGVESLKIQRYRNSLQDLKSYQQNIDTALVNINQMSSGLDENMKQAQNIMSALNIQLSRGDEFDLHSIQQAAKTALQVIEANTNVEVGGRYLFAGSDVSHKPYVSGNNAGNVMGQQVTDWLDGTDDVDTFLADFDALTDSESGFSSTIQTAKSIYVRADDHTEVEYTVKANSEGFKKVINGLRMLSQLDFPDETADVGTKDDFYKIIDHLYATVQTGVDGMRAESAKLGTAAGALARIVTSHENDTQSLQTVLESTEAANTTDAIVKFQTLQTQLEASYNITSVISQLSLARFLGG